MFERKWPSSSKALVGTGLALALITFLMLRAYAARIEAMNPGEPVGVVAAGGDIVRGTVLGRDMLEVVTVPSAFAPPGAIGATEDAAGRVALTDIAAGEAITATRVSGQPSGSLAGLVPAGLRAMVVRASLPDGAVQPGDRVDVLATAEGQTWTDTVGSGLEVLRLFGGADDGFAGEEADRPIALLVDPDQAEVLARAQTIGTLTLTVAPPGEVVAPSPSPTPAPPP